MAYLLVPATKIGWLGVIVTVCCWLFVWYLLSVSAFLWGGLTVAGVILCIIGAVRSNRWFWVPTGMGVIATLGITAGIIFGH